MQLIKSTIKTAVLATIAVALYAPIAQAETLRQFSDRVNSTAENMLRYQQHEAARKNWASSDAASLLLEADVLQDALDDAVGECNYLKSKNRLFTKIQFNKFTHENLAVQLKGLPTFAPSAKQQSKIHYAALATALAYEARKNICPTIVWR